MAEDPFARSITSIDLDLHEQCQKREAGMQELLHALFLIERSCTVIDRLIEERLRVTAAAKQTAVADALVQQ